MKQEWIAGIVLCAIGLCMLLVPAETVWRIAEKWKTEGGARPSRAYRRLLRVVGLVFAAAGIAVAACGL